MSLNCMSLHFSTPTVRLLIEYFFKIVKLRANLIFQVKARHSCTDDDISMKAMRSEARIIASFLFLQPLGYIRVLLYFYLNSCYLLSTILFITIFF